MLGPKASAGPLQILTTMRPTAQRCRLDAFPLTAFVEARYADLDVNGHLNNLALEALHEDIRAKLNRNAFPDVYDVDSRTYRLVTAQNVVHFLAESHWPATITTAIGVGRVGDTSLVTCSGLFVADTCISTCDTTLVLVGSSGPVAIPEHSREVLTTFTLRAPETESSTYPTL